MTKRAYHFLQANMTAASGHEKPWKIGEKRTVEDVKSIKLCIYGYHSSPTLWDCLPYAQGPVACLVEISKPIESDETEERRKAVSASRKLIKAVNIDRELRLFACDCAEHILPIYEKSNSSRAAREAIAVSRRFADGKAMREELDAARAVAWVAAWAAAENVADSVARAVAWGAAENVADSVARTSTWVAARTVARTCALLTAENATGTAERKWQRKHFDSIFGGIFK